MNIASVAVCKNEGLYLKDWIDWHYKLGVDKFFLYDACTDELTFKVLEPYIWDGIVELIPTTFHPCQLQAYSHATLKCRELKFDWVIFSDIDEFLNPHGVESASLKRILIPFQRDGIGGLAFPWHCYGSSESNVYEDIPVWKRITMRVDYEDTQRHHSKHIKSIMRPSFIRSCDDPHWLKTHPLYPSVDFLNRPITISEHKDCYLPTDIVWNHYVTKTKPEWIKKFQRGSADSGADAYNARKLDDYDRHITACSREDKSIWKVAQKLGLMT